MTQKKYPQPTVGTFIINPKGELLLFKTHRWSGLYCVPGGRVEWGETIAQAIKREVKEETGLDVVNIEFICVWDYLPDGNFYKDRHMIFLNHLVYVNKRKVTLDRREAEDYVWVKPKDALKLPLESFTEKTIKQYLL